MDRNRLIATMQDAALAASALVLSMRSANTIPELKPDGSPVTAADQAADALIVARLQEAFPGLPVVSEESAASHAKAPADSFFLVDPIDGTKEFIAGRDEFTVNIALIAGGAPELGVVVAPARDTIWWTEADGTPWRRQRDQPAGRLTPSAARTGQADLIAAVSRSHPDVRVDAWLARFPVTELLVCGSSLKFCLIAEGRADLAARFATTHEWDIAAGHAIVRAAGGALTDEDGATMTYGKQGYRNGPHFTRSARAVAAGY